METRPGDRNQGDFGRDGETLPRDDRLGSVADGEDTEPQDGRPGWFAEDRRTSRATGSARPSTWPPATGTGLNE